MWREGESLLETPWLITERFRDLVAGIDLLICDVWGVIHNGRSAYPDACEALRAFRAGGGFVVLVSNAPRPSSAVVRMLDAMHVPHSAYDRVVTSGDLSRTLISRHGPVRALFLGPERDRGLIDGLPVTLTGAQEAELCICTGFRDDETETPQDYASDLAALARRKVEMICANPDLVVERGDRLIPCAGAMAAAYAERGGAVVYAGKPHLPIYAEALAIAAADRDREFEPGRIMAIGDAVRTDIAGARALGVPSILLLQGIHWHDAGAQDWRARHHSWLEAQPVLPDVVMPRLAW
jgi:HAD superfamily hydrolase (TIGR01459 family)